MSFELMKFSGADEATAEALRFCREFFAASTRKKFILGRNIYADCVAGLVSVDGFIDDYTPDAEYLGRPVVRLADVPAGSLVLNAAGGRPFSAKKRLDGAGFENLDYFALYRLSGKPLIPMRFNEGFSEEFDRNRQEYDWIYGLLADEESRRVFTKLVSFRYDYDLRHLEGFTWREDVQYFEDLLGLRPEGESFVDVGGFNGFTSLEFIKRCPAYGAIDVFEPEPGNHAECVSALAACRDVRIHKLGLSDRKATLFLESQGSGSRVSDAGGVRIDVDTLDGVMAAVNGKPTFIKMDIEGEEAAALEGARRTIIAHHPKLALSVYHKAGDFWQIPRQVLSMRSDYDVFMRHYTECIYETVMFFIPSAAGRAPAGR